MKRRRILVRPEAEQDLDRQADYLARSANLATALKFYRAAENTFRLLARHPKMGRVIDYREPILRVTRMFRLTGFAKHLVFYRPFENGIEVLRGIHGARDIEALFEG